MFYPEKHMLLKRLIGLTATIVFILSGCDTSQNKVGQSASDTKQSSPIANLQLPASPFSDIQLQSFHDSGLQTFYVGVSGEDPGVKLTGISLLEKAVIGAPDNNIYWLDLADAYIYSGMALLYPKAIEIYWMLMGVPGQNKDALLARLSEAYLRVGNQNASFDIAKERLMKATEKETDSAALYLALLTLNNDRYIDTAAALTEKAKSVSKPAYLLLLASSLKELVGDSNGAVDLLDNAIKKLDGQPSQKARLVAERARVAQ